MDTLKWVEEWYLSQCDGKWEHGYGIRISTLDNPGWAVAINLNETALSAIALEYKMVEKDEEDWYCYSIKDAIFKGYGDPRKLSVLLDLFKEIVQQHSS